MKKFCGVILILLFAVVSLTMLYSCNSLKTVENVFGSMDTVVQTKIVTENSKLAKELNTGIKEICEETDGQLSKTTETSDIYRLNKDGTDIDISDSTIDVLKTAKYIKELTGGAYEPALGELVDLWGINENNSILPQKDIFYPAVEKLKDYIIEKVDDKEHVISVSGEKLAFDLGGIGKGYALDRISKYLKGKKISGALISFGSSILATGKNKDNELWAIGVKNPLNPENICGIIGASNKVVSVSGGYERYIEIDGKRYCHIIDPKTGYPADNDLLCTVVIMENQSGENNGAISDALSTALYVMGKQGALDFYAKGLVDFEMILFVKANNEKGFDIICTNVIFEEIE